MAPPDTPDPVKPANGNAAAEDDNLSGVAELAGMLNGHKGKLAIGVAATLGLMVFYSWREKRLATEDPEAHALHQKSKAILKAAESQAAQEREDIAEDTQAARRAREGKNTLRR
jgi:uncharacterized protein HemX